MILVWSFTSAFLGVACSTEDTVTPRLDATAHDVGQNATDAAYDAGPCGPEHGFMYLFTKPGCDESVQAVPLCVPNAVDGGCAVYCSCDGKLEAAGFTGCLIAGYGNPTRYRAYSPIHGCNTPDTGVDAFGD